MRCSTASTAAATGAMPVVCGPATKVVAPGVVIGYSHSPAYPVTPPPAYGSKGVSQAVPGLAILVAGTWTVNWLVLRNVVASSTPFHRTVDPEMKLEPYMFRLFAEPPEVVVMGVTQVMRGARFELCEEVIRKTAPREERPAGEGKTLTRAEPALAISDAVIVACNVVLETNVVDRLLPFQYTCDPEVNPPP